MYATGRKPNTRGLGLAEIGVETTENGAVVVDEWSCSNVPNIYAVGDVTDRINLTPVAIAEGRAVAETLFNTTRSRWTTPMCPRRYSASPRSARSG